MFEASSFLCSVFQVGQSQFQHGNDLRWSEIDYYIQHRQIRLDIVYNAREDIQDRFDKDLQNIDSNLVVVTLMLGIGFGFVIEGTYSGLPTHTGGSVEQWFRRLYAIVAGLSIVFPFLSMLSFWECRHRLIFFMKGFHEKHYQPLIHKLHEEFSADSGRADAMSANMHTKTLKLPHVALTMNDATRAFACCRRRRDERAARDSTHTPAQVRRSPTVREIDVLSTWPEAYTGWWDTWIAALDGLALMSLHLALHCNILCCAILLGLYFHHTFKHEVWIAYISVVMLGWIVALCASFQFARTEASYKKAMESGEHLLSSEEGQPRYGAA